MKNIKVVIGANFGDEGKGLMTDFFCEQLLKKADGRVLNVRFNATSQAGHTVTRDNKRHVFSHFGSGSLLANVATYLSSDFFFNPISFFKELSTLEKMSICPDVYLCSKSQAINIYDVFFNCIIEDARGKERHGSCGAGLWEAVNRVKAGYEIIALDMDEPRAEVKEKLLAIRDRYYGERIKEYGLTIDESNEWYEMWNSDTALENYLDMFFDMKEQVKLVEEEDILNKWDNQVYEGAQGLLLDYDNDEYMPNITASYTGSKNVAKLFNKIDGKIDAEICYVSRTYFTRHGAGRFATEAPKQEVEAYGLLMDDTNVTNRWQGGFRWGYFDEALYLETIMKDQKWLSACNHKAEIKRTVSFTHTDCTSQYILMPKAAFPVKDFVKKLPDLFGNYYCCNGKTAKTVELYRICR